MFSIAITGHRELKDKKRVEEEIKAAIKTILQKHGVKRFNALTSLATGADTVFADVAEKYFHAKVKVVVPFDADEYKNDFKDESERIALASWLSKYPAIHTVEPVLPHVINRQWRDEAYFNCGKYLVDNCNVLIVIWNGSPPAGVGGTAEVYAYAYLKKKETWNLNAETISQDIIVSDLKHEKSKADNSAMFWKKYFHGMWLTCIGCAFAAASFFAARIAYGTTDAIKLQLIVAEFSCVVVVLIITLISKRNKAHKNFLKYRLKAEKLRLLEIFYVSRIPVPISDSEISGLKNLAGRVNDSILSTTYTSDIFTCFTIKKLIDEQKKYHSNRINKRIGESGNYFEKFLSIIAGLFVLNIFLHLTSGAIEFYDKEFPISYPPSLSILFGITIPATYAACEAVRVLYQWKQQRKSSESMMNFFNRTENDFATIQSRSQHEALLVKISKAMLAENEDWHTSLLDIDSPPVLV